MSPKTLQYLMGHSDIGVTLNTYTHLGLEDAAEEIKRMENLEKARKEMYGEEKGKTDETKYVQGGIRIGALRPTGLIWSACFCLKSSGKIK